MTITPVIRPTSKQCLAWDALSAQSPYRYIVFGGGAGGGKSWLGCEWLLTHCYFYPGSKWFIGREELTRLMGSTFLTFVKASSFHRIPTQDWKLNGQYHYIEFFNGSRIDLLDLKYLPSDPLYERFGSLEYTGGFIDEAGEVDFAAFDILKTRVGRHCNEKYPAKILLTCNPNKGWLYRSVYVPFREKTLPADYCFIPSLYSDNSYIAKDYELNLLQISDTATKQRLMLGNWEYDDDPATLIEFEAILDAFTNSLPFSTEKYITADIARYGNDKTVIGVWHGLELIEIHTFEKEGVDSISLRIGQLIRDKAVPYSHVIVDEDGVGGGVVDILRGIKGFTANATPFDNPLTHQKDNFQNLKTQCYYKLAKKINQHELSIRCNDQKVKQFIIQELEQVKSKDTDKDGKKKIVPKDEVKEIIGRSPDYSDMMMMRMYFEFAPKKNTMRSLFQFFPQYVNNPLSATRPA